MLNCEGRAVCDYSFSIEGKVTLDFFTCVAESYCDDLDALVSRPFSLYISVAINVCNIIYVLSCNLLYLNYLHTVYMIIYHVSTVLE